MAGSETGPFPAAALEANRAGRLTDDQRRAIGGEARSWRRNELTIAIGFGVIGVLLLTATGANPSAGLRLPGGIALLALAAIFLVRSAGLGDALGRDARSGKVENVEGAIGKHHTETTSGGSSLGTYYLDVAGHRFETSRSGYEVAPDVGWVRVFYLASSRQVVNLERLPDRPGAEGTASSPGQAIDSLAAALHGHDTAQVNEARAEMAAFVSAGKAAAARAATPPPAADRDQRPLSEAILGRWESAGFAVTFAPGGTMTASMFGREKEGRWSVDSGGRLHADLTGHEQGADAWVAGDTLTISENGRGLTFTRVTGG